MCVITLEEARGRGGGRLGGVQNSKVQVKVYYISYKSKFRIETRTGYGFTMHITEKVTHMA